METLIYKCPNCGGALQFDPDSQQYECEYCQSEFDQVQMDDQTSDEQLEDASGAVLYHCPSCGAEIVTDDTTAATFCFYCHNPVVLTGKLGGSFQPNQIIPFQINKEKAIAIFQSWVKQKKYLPTDFYSANQVEKISGVYFPYWLYHCQVDGKLDAVAKKIKVWRTGDLEYTELKSYHIVREGSMKIDHVPRNALKKADRRLVDSVLPFEMDQLKDFSMSYLSGFFAEKRDQEKEEFVQEIKQEVNDYAISSLKNSVNLYQNVSINQQEAKLTNEVWQYTLFPVWTLTYRDQKNDKIYYFACNGQTGKISGELPVDQKKLGFLFLIIFVVVFMAMLIMGYLI